MATSDVRVQYQFVDASDAISNGWTENFYFHATSAGAALGVVSALPNIALRTSCLGADYRLTQVRCVAVGNRADSANMTFPPAIGTGRFITSPGEQFNSEQPWDALLWRINAAGGSGRNWLMRGVPTGIFKDTMNIGTAQPNYLTNLTNLGNYIGGTGHPSSFELRQLVPSSPTPASLPNFINNNRQLVLTVSVPLPVGMVVKATIRVRGMISVSPSPNHLWRIQDIATSGGTSLITMFPSRRSYYGTGGGPIIIDLMTPAFVGFQGMTPIRAAKKATGRPPAQLRGRASARRG